MFAVLKKVAASLVVFSFLGGCALTVDTVDVPFERTMQIVPIEAAGSEVALQVVDLRTKYKGRIGAKINGFGTEMADIKSTVPVRDIVANAFQAELEARQISLNDGGPKKVDVDITAFHNSFKFGLVSGEARAIVTFRVGVTNATGVEVFSRTVSEIEARDGIMVATGENAAISLKVALKKAMDSIFENQEFLSALASA